MTEKGRIYEDYFLTASWLKYQRGWWSAWARFVLWLRWRRLDAVTVDTEEEPVIVPVLLPRKNLTQAEVEQIWKDAPYRTEGESNVA